MSTNDDKQAINQQRIGKALAELLRHPYADLVITKHNGVIRGFRISSEVRFTEEKNNE